MLREEANIVELYLIEELALLNAEQLERSSYQVRVNEEFSDGAIA